MEELKCVYNGGILPENTMFFKEEEYSQILNLSKEGLGISKVLSATIAPEVEAVRVVSTELGKSNEGTVLTGKKVIVELNMKQKLTYIANENIQNSQVAYFEELKSFFIIVPEKFNERSICDLIRLNKFVINPYVEHISTRVLDSERIFECVLVYVGIKLF